MYTWILNFLVVSVIYLYVQLYKEKRRNRILQAFVGGLYESVQKSIFAIETYGKKEKATDDYFKSIQKLMLSHTAACFEEDYCETMFDKWLKKGKNIFYEENYSNGGFNQLYLNFYDYELQKFKNSKGVRS